MSQMGRVGEGENGRGTTFRRINFATTTYSNGCHQTPPLPTSLSLNLFPLSTDWTGTIRVCQYITECGSRVRDNSCASRICYAPPLAPFQNGRQAMDCDQV